jgi:hypothetical protein
MDTAFISALSALAGSVVGGLTSGATTWLSQRSQAQAGQRMHNLSQRETLYQEFVVVASEAYGNALVSAEPEIQRIVVLHGMISRMRILSSSQVIGCAEKTMELIIDANFLPAITLLEMRELAKEGQFVDPLREFSKVCRDELRVISSGHQT